jgi:hypothetical protein
MNQNPGISLMFALGYAKAVNPARFSIWNLRRLDTFFSTCKKAPTSPKLATQAAPNERTVSLTVARAYHCRNR